MEVLQDRPEIQNMIEAVAQEQGLTNFVIADVQTNQKGEGFAGQILMVTVEEPSSAKKLELVIKAAYGNENIRDLVPIEMSYLNEIHFYTEIYPEFRKLEMLQELVPKCYKVFGAPGKELICLENLKSSNFEVFDKRQLLDGDHVSSIFQLYGRFHAYGFALQDQKPKEYLELTGKLHNTLLEFLNQPNGAFKKHFRDFGALVQKYFVSGQDDDLIKKFEKYTGDGIVDIFTGLLTEKCDYSTILHGDCWSNNMMFRYENSFGKRKLKEVRLLDMQVVTAASPVYDLSYCLYSGASKTVLDNLDKYLKVYYESFSSFLRKLGGDPQKLFPFVVLKSHWKKYSKFGMLQALAILRMKSTKKEHVVDFTDVSNEEEINNMVAHVKFNEEEFGGRVKDLLRHMINIDAL